MRMLSHQPKLSQGEYFLTSKMDMILESDSSGRTATPRQEEYHRKFQESFDQLQDFVTAFERGEDKFKALYATRAKPLASGVC